MNEKDKIFQVSSQVERGYIEANKLIDLVYILKDRLKPIIRLSDSSNIKSECPSECLVPLANEISSTNDILCAISYELQDILNTCEL